MMNLIVNSMGALPRFYYIDITLILFFHKTYFRSDLLEI